MTTEERIKKLKREVSYYKKEAEEATLHAQSFELMLEALQTQQQDEKDAQEVYKQIEVEQELDERNAQAEMAGN